MRHADDRRVDHVGMVEQHVLDLDAVHVLAAADDHVLGAIDEVQEAVGVEVADVAGVEPAVGERRLVGIGPRRQYPCAITVGPLIQISPRSPRG